MTAIAEEGVCAHAPNLPGSISIMGKPVHYQNAALPTTPNGSLVAPLATCVCAQCGHGYAELMIDAAAELRANPDAELKPRRCSECRLQEFELSQAAAWFREGGGYAVSDVEFCRNSLSDRNAKGKHKKLAIISY